ncbi:DUF1501 domain-containing protein [Methylibium sp.]|uniref:DUF1501 domain-containing protein n=1 Tax=Methylibium sp. TaxID=2067992 RepID=UPI00286CC1EE|nr:DUF1501 domain-containing protein [Methylibium sp.]
MHKPSSPAGLLRRRAALQAGLIGAGWLTGLPGALQQACAAAPVRDDKRILVVLELSGGNDGLNTLVPYGDDAYYRHRPKLGIRPKQLRVIDEHHGFNPGMAGFERLYKDGRMAVVHGCGYAQPSFSHFTSMAYWHTAMPNSGEEYGWIGRLADAIDPKLTPNFVINIDETQSLAVRARHHLPVSFDDPKRFIRKGLYEQRRLLDAVPEAQAHDTPSLRFMRDVAESVHESSRLVREACARYKTPVDYGIVPLDLPKIAALIAADMPTRLYYSAFRRNAFDTHVQQAELHQRLLTYASDSVAGFMQDMERIGRAKDVTLLVFSEFGRRVPENTSLGTDHGTANHMYVIGQPVRGGHYGTLPSLTQLDEGDNLIHTTDFRRVYASLIEGWLGADAQQVLRGRFEGFPIFG